MINEDFDALVKTAKKHVPNYLGENTQDPKKQRQSEKKNKNNRS
ncbi:hypothetical protein ACLM5H_20875 [Fredinandcohnia humi]